MSTTKGLTGGTGDVSPQIFTLPVNQLTTVNTYRQIQVPLPVNRFAESSGKVVIIELLKVLFNMPEADAANTAGGNSMIAACQISTSSLVAYDPNDPKVVTYSETTFRGAFTAAGTFMSIRQDPTVIDLTDGAGHGILIATDNIFFAGITAGFAAAPPANPAFGAKLIYRFKRVGLQEYIGIAQSQQ